MEINIKTVKIDDICLSSGENRVIKISDEELVRLGKKYFELASKGEKKDTTDQTQSFSTVKIASKDEMTDCARKLKAFCDVQISCNGCPFVIEDTGGLYGCKIGCRTGTKVYTPYNWEV